jgi:hypothetical protein
MLLYKLFRRCIINEHEESYEVKLIPIENVELQIKNFKEAPTYHWLDKAGHNNLIRLND